METPMSLRSPLLGLILAVAGLATARSADLPLVLEAKIPLGAVSGRIDYLAIDLKRQRLLVAELGNDSLGVVDLVTRTMFRRISDLREPQGVGYEPMTDTVYVANANDGSVRLFKGEDLSVIGRIELGSDADNIRIDAERQRVLIGYGNGAIAIIDPAKQAKVAEFPLPGHPEGFQTDSGGTKLYANVPDARKIAFVDLANAMVRTVETDGARGNFPMAVDARAKRILIVFRNPPTLIALAIPGWGPVAKADTCADADDVFVDGKRSRVYVSCGEGALDVFAAEENGFTRVARVPTISGARTSLFVLELDRLYLAVRSSWSESPAIWVFRPAT
jgi:hypothetical protein